MKFRKKPVVIEAMRFTGDNCIEVVRFIGGPWENLELHNTDLPVIKTLEGDMTASPGDWIIRGVKGEFYPCKPDIFAATYEVSDTSSSGSGHVYTYDSNGRAETVDGQPCFTPGWTTEDTESLRWVAAYQKGDIRKLMERAAAALSGGDQP